MGTPVENLPSSATARVVIAHSGKYFLSKALTGQAGKNGIEVLVSDVEIDLGGYSLAGVEGSCSGVVAGPGVRGCSVANGHVVGWSMHGVDLREATESRLVGLSARGNAQSGLRLGAGGLIDHCASSANGAWGIEATGASSVQECSCRGNRAGGIRAGAGCRILSNFASSNPRGVLADIGCHIEGNTTSGNAVGFVVTGRDNLLIRNVSRDGAAFRIAPGNAYGPLADVAGAGALSAVANADHPWANFSYGPAPRAR